MKQIIDHTLPLRETPVTDKLHELFGNDITFLAQSADGHRIEVNLNLRKITLKNPNKTLHLRMIINPSLVTVALQQQKNVSDLYG